MKSKQQREFEEMLEHYDEAERTAGQPDVNAELTYGETQAARKTKSEPAMVKSYEKTTDKTVEKPNHCIWFDMEVREVIEKTLSTCEYLGYLKGCSLKHRLSANEKKIDFGLQDLTEAEKYEWFYEQFKAQNQPSK